MQGDTCQITTNTVIFPIGQVSSCKARHIYFIDEKLTWKNHIEVVENKISKNIGVLYRASNLLDFKNLLKIYFSFIHIYISYANIA